jgi:PAS domain S-box-containing protein
MNERKKRSTHSILFSLMLIISMVVVATSAIFTVLLVQYRTKDLIEREDSRLLTAAELTREMIGPNYHDQINDETSVSKEQFRHIVARNDDLCRRLNLQYLWSVLLVEDRLVFTAATHSDLNDPDSPCATFFEIHRDPEAFASAMQPELKTSFSSFRNEWGEGRQVLIPRKDAHGRTYIFGASVQLTELNDMVRRTIINSIVIGLGVFSAAFLLALVLARSFTVPISRLTEAAGRMATGDLNVPLASAGTRELQSLSNSLDHMRQGLIMHLEALRESEAIKRTIVESIPQKLFLKDCDSAYLYVNKSYATSLRLKPEDFVGKDDFAFYPAELAGKYRADDLEVMESGQEKDIEETFKTDGKDYLVRTIKAPVRNGAGKVTALLGIFEDITERKRSEDALRESENRYRSLFEMESDAIFLIDNQTGRILEANRAASLLYGFSRDELLTKRNTDLSAEPEETQRQTQGNPVVSDNMVTIPLRVHRKKDGTEFPVEITGRFFLQDGRPVHIAAIRDITERKGVEDERKRLEERLHRAEKMEALGTMAGGVAHDLNNVLGIVVGYSEMLLGDLDESSSVKSEAMEILKAGQRAAAIVQDLLTLTRRGVPSRKVLHLNNILMECQELPEFAKLCSLHPNVRVETDLEADLLHLNGSSIHLGKSFLNLFSNAMEAMPHGGVVTIRTRNQYLDKPVSGYDEIREGDYVVLSVSDTGEGIPLADLKRIFEPFYSKKVMGRSGTGLGLAVVWGTVKDHHGYINVESDEGEGTTFTLYFPVTREDTYPEEVVLSASEYVGNGESILVVDDVKEQRYLATMMLTKLNYRVITVSSGEEALKYLQEHTVDLVVLDMIMDPGMDGLDTYRKILEIRPLQKAIIVSGFSETERVTKTQELGAGAYVKKPYVLEKLGLAVRKELERLA